MMKGTFGKLLRGGQSAEEATVFDTATPQGRLDTFFREVEASNVVRRLTLSVDDARMSFDVANKRVLKFVEVVPDTDGRGKIAAEIVRDYDNLDVQLKVLAELVTAFVARPGIFDSVSRPSPVTYPAKMDGFQASEWRFACELYGVISAEQLTRPVGANDGAPAKASPEPAVAEAAAPVAQPVVAAPIAAPARVPEPAMAVAAAADQLPADADTISSIITALGSSPSALARDVVQAEPAAKSAPSDDRAKVENFYESVAKHCDLSMLITEQGDVVQFSDSAAGWFDIGPDIAHDMKAWVMETAKIMPGCQLVVMRSPVLQHQSVIFMTNGSLTAFGAFSSHVTGRIFSIANEFVGRKR
jgi:hypothetical protein